MKRNRILVLPSVIVIAIAILTMFFQITGTQSVSAETDMKVWGDPHVGLVINTTSGMGPEINQIKSAWSQFGTSVYCLTCTHSLTQFRDSAMFVGLTQNEVQFGNWLDELNATGGGECADNTFAGLREFARNVPGNAAPVSDAIVFSDSPPMGNRSSFGFILDKMLENNIRVHTVGRSLCNNENIPGFAINYLALLTGGEFYNPTSPGDYMTETMIAMNFAMSKDLFMTYMGEVNESVIVYPLYIDSSVSLVAEEKHEWSCLTCTRSAENTISFANISDVTVELIDPKGNVVDASTPGYVRLTSDSRDMQIMFETLRKDSGEWKVRVSGTGEYNINVFGNSSLHMTSMGRHVARANRPFEVRALIFPDNIEAPLTATLKLVGVDHFGEFPVDMFNIGMPPNVYGGSVNVPTPGLYRLVAEGALKDGSKFTRVDPTPIRIRAHDMTGSGDAPSLPGSTRLVTFNLVNDGVPGRATATTFDLELFSEQGWTTSDGIPASVALNPGESVQYTVSVIVPANADIGLVEDSTLVAVPQDDLAGTASSSARTIIVDQLNIYLPLTMK